MLSLKTNNFGYCKRIKLKNAKLIIVNLLICVLGVFALQTFLFFILELYAGYYINKEKEINLNIIESAEYVKNYTDNYIATVHNDDIIIIQADTATQIKRISYKGKQPVYYRFIEETQVLLFCFSDWDFENIIIGSYNIFSNSIYEFAHTSNLPEGYAVSDCLVSAETNVFYFRLRYKNNNDFILKKDVLYRYDLFENFEFITYLDTDSNIIVGKTKDFVFFDTNEGILFYDAAYKTFKPYFNKNIKKLPFSGVSDELLHNHLEK